jgi:hypothetical protein
MNARMYDSSSGVRMKSDEQNYSTGKERSTRSDEAEKYRCQIPRAHPVAGAFVYAASHPFLGIHAPR